MGETIGVIELFKLIKNRWYVVLLTSALGFLLAMGVSTFLIEPQYTTFTNILVSRPQTADQRLDMGEIQTNIQMINTYRDVIEDAAVLGKVSEEMNGALTPGQLLDKISVLTQSDSQIFSIRVTDTDPVRAAQAANAVAAAFKDRVAEVLNVRDISILSPAIPNENPISPNVFFNEIVGAIAGAILGIALILIQTIADTKVRDEDFISEGLGWNRLGTVTSIQKEDLPPLQPSAADEQVVEEANGESKRRLMEQAKGNVHI